ncbi:TIGR03085 family metal-binding protein [Kocuria sp. p3-SID1433]|uniref:TIGR03085 family metal-binding protein n=1 Tax=unclassified Kocuria TaxID=2649579 RepID=UPI0021A5B73F|nr:MULTISPECIES: TIGR03085 family metal-binding protein [unclassified Kocuria]MCT1601470.1 TIGR03085 family metal-binding protein [Kocuria sp. p3-SID1428]MCT2179371.1 TIGR03085 family metal-binding protein [Kocuria sp. p3-SID1433]
MTNFAVVERRHLAALLRRVGPEAPTLCEGWLTRDLAVHLIERDSRPDLIAGTVLPKIPVLTKRAQEADAQLRGQDWAELVAKVEKPAVYSPARLGPLDKRMNTAEFFVHHEDVRRAQESWHRRQLLQEEERDLWAALKLMGKPLLRPEQDSVLLVANGYGSVSGGKAKTSTVRIVRGTPSELLLWAFGRREQAEVAITDE